jgi:hypothetical protein
MVGAVGAGADRATASLQFCPLPVAIDEHAALVESAVEQQRCAGLDPREVGEVDTPAEVRAKARGQAGAGAGVLIGEGNQQVKVGARVLLATRQRAVEHSQSHAALGAQGVAKFREKRPVDAQVLALASVQAQPAGTWPMATQRALPQCTAQRALLGADLFSQLPQ